MSDTPYHILHRYGSFDQDGAGGQPKDWYWADLLGLGVRDVGRGAPVRRVVDRDWEHVVLGRLVLRDWGEADHHVVHPARPDTRDDMFLLGDRLGHHAVGTVGHEHRSVWFLEPVWEFPADRADGGPANPWAVHRAGLPRGVASGRLHRGENATKVQRVTSQGVWLSGRRGGGGEPGLGGGIHEECQLRPAQAMEGAGGLHRVAPLGHSFFVCFLE